MIKHYTVKAGDSLKFVEDCKLVLYTEHAAEIRELMEYIQSHGLVTVSMFDKYRHYLEEK